MIIFFVLLLLLWIFSSWFLGLASVLVRFWSKGKSKPTYSKSFIRWWVTKFILEEEVSDFTWSNYHNNGKKYHLIANIIIPFFIIVCMSFAQRYHSWDIFFMAIGFIILLCIPRYWQELKLLFIKMFSEKPKELKNSGKSQDK